MDKRLIQPLEGWMAIPEIVGVLRLSRARVHQLIDEDRFALEDMRVVGDKRMVLIKNAAVYKQLQHQEDRAARLAADKAEEERRTMGRLVSQEAVKAMRQNNLEVSAPLLEECSIPEPTALDRDELTTVPFYAAM